LAISAYLKAYLLIGVLAIMAMTVIGFYHKYDQALQTLEDLVANEYDSDSTGLRPGRPGDGGGGLR
jgi:hypothetical protein